MTLFWAAEPSSTILIKDGNQSTSNMATYSTGIVGIDGHKNEVKMAVTLLSFGSFLRFPLAEDVIRPRKGTCTWPIKRGSAG